MYYVYEWYIVDTGHIFYVGKGTRNRYKVHSKRNKLFMNVYNEFNCESRIIKFFDNEKDAFEYEAKYIKELKAKGQCDCNIHIGGAGGSGEYWTEELRKEYSVNNVMKRQEQRTRMSITNPMKNKEIALKTNAQKKCRIQIGETIYSSLADAASKMNCSTYTITQWYLYGETEQGEKCINLDYQNSKKRGAVQKPFYYKDELFNNYEEFNQKYHIKHSTLKSWLSIGFDTEGNYCRRIDDKRELEYHKNSKSIPIIINGIKYPSLTQAEKQLPISRETISNYLKGKTFNPNYICIYDNQQPI